MSSWIKRLQSKISHSGPGDRLPGEILALLPLRQAAALRTMLKNAMVGNSHFPFPELQDRAKAAGWRAVELEKLAAYGEFFSGLSAVAYHRVMTGRLAQSDYALFMTACIHCYLFDRFEEGYALLRQFRPDEAESLDEGEFLAYAGYIAFAGGGSAAEAMAYFDRALDRGLFSPLLVVNAYPIYFEAGRHERVDQLRRLLHERYREDQEAVYAVACVELARDYYAEGFRLAEARYRMPEVARSINPTLLARPRWQGEPLAGKRLLVHGEQGYGDIVMMARYLPLLAVQGAQVVVDCREAAVTLLAHNYPDCEMVAGDLKNPVAAGFDVWTGGMSLPFHFDTTAESVPATQGYLAVPPEQADYWRGRLAELAGGDAPRIGLAWSGNPTHRADRRRSIPFGHIARVVRDHPLLRFFALQTSVPDNCPANLVNVSEEMVTLADTAALIAEMDLVITVDTSIVHIAGALGKTAWLLLPHRYEWRWSLAGETNNWYASVRVIRQQRIGDWDSVLEEAFGRRLGEFCKGIRQ